MWKIEFNRIDYRDELLAFEGDVLETYMAINQAGRLETGLRCLSFFAENDIPYDDIISLYRELIRQFPDELKRKLWNHADHPINLVQDIFIQNRMNDKKKKG